MCYTNFPSTKGEKPMTERTWTHDPHAVYGPIEKPFAGAVSALAQPASPSNALIARFDAAVKNLICTIAELEQRLESSVAHQDSTKTATPNMKDQAYASPLLRRLDELVNGVEEQIAVMQRLLGRLEI